MKYNFFDRPEPVSITWDDGFNFSDRTWFKVFHQCEPPEVIDIIDKLIQNHKFYDLILAWDDRVLAQCSNAVFLTESACSWMDRKSGKLSPAPLGQMRVEGYDTPQSNVVVANYTPFDGPKNFAASFITSSKSMFPGHKLRQEIYSLLPERIGQLNIRKHKSPPWLSDKRELLETFQFHVVCENSKHNGYYSEKIVDCFIAKTVPIYWGCPNIGKHFDSDGIIAFETAEEAIRILETLTAEDYTKRLPVIERNFHMALKGVHQWDLIEQAISNGIASKLKNGTITTVEPPMVEQFTLTSPRRMLRRK